MTYREKDPMDNLVQWLREQLDEDERIARAVRVPHDWHQGPGDDPEWTDAEMVCMWPPEFHTPYERDKHWRGLTVEGPELAAHIAVHDPARVLREIDAKRQIIEQHERYVRERRRMMGGWDPQSDDSPILAALATVYADRPGYRDDWRP